MALQSTVNEYLAFGVVGSFYDASPRRTNAMIVTGGDDIAAVAASATATMAGDVADDGDVFVIGGRTYRFKDTMAQANDVKIGATIAATMGNLVAAINGTGTEGVEYYAGTAASGLVTSSAPDTGAITLTATQAGTIGNSILISTTVAEITLSGSALEGGVDAVDVDAVVGYAFTVDSSNKNQANVGGDGGIFAGILVNPKNQTKTGLDATLVVADGMIADLCTMGHIVVKPANSITVGMSAYYDDLTGQIYGYTGTGAQTGKTLISGSQFIRVDSTSPSGLAVLSITGA